MLVRSYSHSCDSDSKTSYFQGADVNAENGDGVTVLTMAVLHNHIDCIPLLVNEGAELNHQSARY